MSILEGLGSIGEFFLEVISLIPKMMYYLTVAAMSLMDIAQLLLRKMAGLDVYYVGDSSEPITGDIALSFLKSIFEKESAFPALKNAFWSLVILGFILLIVTTIIAIIRQEYMPGDEDSKEKPSNNKIFVISRSIKSLFLFLIVPVSAIFGLMLSDIILVALDSATQSSDVGGALFTNSQIMEKLESSEIIGLNGSTTTTYEYTDIFGLGNFPTSTVTFSGMIFKSSAYIANRVRINDSYSVSGESKKYYQLVKNGDISNFGIFDKTGGSTESGMIAEMAQTIDEAFASNVKLKTPTALKTDGAAKNFKSYMIFGQSGKVTHFSKFNVGLVWYYYNLWQFNFLVAFAFIVVCFKLLIKIVMGLMKRIIELVALFIVSPPIVAIMPLDGGKAFGEWRKNFISKALSAYGAIVGMNLFFLILPYINEIKFFSADAMGWTSWGADAAIGMINILISTIFIVAGLVSVEGFIELLSGIIGSESTAKTGGEMVGKVGDTLAKSARLTGGVAGLATKAVTAPLTVPLKAAGVDQKLAKLGGKMKQGLKRSIAFGGKKGAQAKKDIRKQWNKGGAQKAYNAILDSNEKYSESMNDAFENRKTGENMSFDDWRNKTEEGKSASQNAVTLANASAKPKDRIDDFNTFKLGATKNEQGKLVVSEAYKDFQKSQMDDQTKTFGDAFSLRRQAVAGSGSAGEKFFSNVGGVLGKESLGVLKHANSYASNFPYLMTDAFERTNKQGMKSMIMAFRGDSYKEIELSEIKEKLRDEESMKAEINEEQRAKANKKAEEEKAKDNKVNKRLESFDKELKRIKEEKNKK